MTPIVAFAGPQVFNDVAVEMTDLREYAGTGFGGEGAHVVRFDFKVVNAGSTNVFTPPAPPPGSTVTVTSTGFGRFFGVDSAYAANLTLAGGSPGSSQSFSGGTISAINVPSTTNFEFRLSGASTRNVYWIDEFSGTYYYTDANGNQSSPQTGVQRTIHKATLVLTRRNLDAVALDSRRTYGQPNLGGAYPADANAPLRNPSFAGWVFRGGLFAGNAPAGANDSSGTARVQLWTPSAAFTYHLLSSYTLFSLGRSPRAAFASNSVPLRIYAPATTDPNLAATSTSANWGNRWDLATATSVSDVFTPEVTSSPDYFRVLTETSQSRLSLVLDDEATKVSGGYAGWQYFSSAPYEALQTAFPLNDSRPRVWTVDRTFVN